jgi:hypothetical protein
MAFLTSSCWRFLFLSSFWLLLASHFVPAQAQDALRLSGFGTLGYVSDNRTDIAPVRDITQKPDKEFSTGSTWKVDTRLGLQMEVSLGPKADLVAQLVARDQLVHDLNSSVELTYLAWRPDSQWDVRAGRINYDAFLMSDHRNVGYAYPWVRPPTEFYGWIPAFSVDGLDAAYALQAADARWRLKVQTGNSAKVTIPIGEGYDFRAKDMVGISLTRQSESWRLKAAYSHWSAGDEVPAFAPLHAGLDAFAAAGIPGASAEAASLRNSLSFQGTRVTYLTLGASYDDGQWVMQAEAGRSTATTEIVPHGRTGYFSVGRRMGNWTPLLTVSTSRPEHAIRPAANSWGPFNAPLRDPALFVLNSNRIEQDTLSAGVRWEFHRQAAAKLQWDRTTIKPSGYGLWWRDLAINDAANGIDMLSLTVDFVF